MGRDVGIQTSQRFANQLFLESDFVLAVGARFAERHTGDLDVYRGERTFVHIDIAPRQIGRVSGRPRHRQRRQAGARGAAGGRPGHDAGAGPGAWVERVYELRSTMLRRMDFDDEPIKPQRVFKEMNEYFDATRSSSPRSACTRSGAGSSRRPTSPATTSAAGRRGRSGGRCRRASGPSSAAPDKLVVGVVGDYSFGFLMEEVAVAVQHQVPFVLVMVNNGYMSLIRQPEKTSTT